MAWFITLGTSQSTNEAANQSTVSATLYLNWNNYDSFAGYDTEGYINIGGNVAGAAAPRQVNYPNAVGSGSVAILSHSVTFTHDANGYRGAVGTSGSYDGDGGYSPGDLSVGGTTYGAIDYDRKPAAPSTVTPVLNADKSITVTSNAVSSPAGTATYYVGYSSSSDGGATWGAWSSYTTIPSNARSYTYTLGSLTQGLTYRFRMYASNSDGSSAATTSGTNVFLPAGAKIWNGTEWKNGTVANIYTSTGWKPITTAKTYNGTSWVNLT